MARLRPWILLGSVLFLASSSARAEVAVPEPPECLPAAVLAALEEAGLLPPDGGQGSGGGADQGPGAPGDGPTAPGSDGSDGHDSGDGGPGHDIPWSELPYFWWYTWYTTGDYPTEIPPACEDLPPPPASFVVITIDDPEDDPFFTPYASQDIAGQVISVGSELQDITWVNLANFDFGLVDVFEEQYLVEGIELEIGPNPIVVFGSNESGASDSDTITVIRNDDYCATHQGNVTCTEFWCGGDWEMPLIKPQYRTWLEQHPSGIGVLYPIHGDFPPATDLPPPPADPLDAALTYSVFQENGQAKLRFHAELRSFDSLPTPFTLGEVAVQVTASGENGDTTLVLDPLCYDQAEGFYDLNGEVFGYVDAILPYEGTTTVTATLIELDEDGDPVVPTVKLGSDRATFVPNDKPIATTEPVPNGLVAQINDSGLNVVDSLLTSQVSGMIKDGLENPPPPPNDAVTLSNLGVGSVVFNLAETGALASTVTLQNLGGHIKVHIPIIGDCHIDFEVSTATVAKTFDQVPAPQPSQVDLVSQSTSTSFSTPSWTSSGNCSLLPGNDEVDAVDQVTDGILTAIADSLEPAIEDELNGLGLGDLVGDLLQVEFEGTFSSIDDLTALARYNVDAHFQSLSGNALVTESFAPPGDFVPFGTTAPGVGGFDLGVYLTPAGLNQLLAARTNDGLLATQVTELTPGDPLTVKTLKDFGVGFPSDASDGDPVILELMPSMAPMTTGQIGPDGEMYQLDIWQLLVKILWTDGDGNEIEALRLAVDLSLGLDVSFAGPGAPPSTDLSQPSSVFTEILSNPYGSNEVLVPIAVGFLFAQGFDGFVGDLIGDGSGPLGFLGLDVDGEGALRAGDSMALLFDLAVAPTQATLVFDQDGIEDISVEFDVTFPFDGVSFAWDFGDGDNQITSVPNVTHIYGGLPGNGGLPVGLHDFGVKVDVTRANGAVVSGYTAILICIKENPDDICEM